MQFVSVAAEEELCDGDLWRGAVRRQRLSDQLFPLWTLTGADSFRHMPHPVYHDHKCANLSTILVHSFREQLGT
jgi:hypothetical protein